MSSTTVHSNKSTGSVAGSAFIATEKTLEIPPKSQVFKAIPNYVEEQGNIEIPVSEGYVTEKSELVKADGTKVAMKNKNAFEEISKHKNQKDKMRSEASKAKKEVEVDR